MPKNAKNLEQKVDDLTLTVKDLGQTVGKLAVNVDQLTGNFDQLTGKVNELAVEMRRGFKAVEKKTDKKIDELAALTARGFEEVDKKFNQNDKMHQIFADELQFVRSDINGLKINTSDELKSHNFRLNRLERKVGVVPLKD